MPAHHCCLVVFLICLQQQVSWRKERGIRIERSSPALLWCGRYLKDLPAGLSAFNDSCLEKQARMPQLVQNVDEVRKIVHEAMVLPPNSAFANGNALIDSFNGEPEDGMDEDGSLEYQTSY